MAINLATKYEPKLDERFTQKSLTDAFCGKDYEFNGVNGIKVYTLGQATINNYTASGTNRFGTPTELEDEVNTYTLAQKKSFAHTLDITNVQDQLNIKRANSVIKQIWDEQMVPMIDQYRLGAWANGAGTTVLNSTALTKSTVVEAILTGGAALNNALVARDGRVCFITETMAVKTKLAAELANNESYTTKAIVNGEIARLNGMPIVSVPDSYMPKGVEFMIKYKRATVDPMKLKHMRAHVDPPGIAGTLLEGLVRFDSFVLAQKAMGIYVYGQSDMVATPTASLSSSKIALASTTDGTTIYYTTDGSNPKTSSTRSVYSSTLTVVSGTTLKFYAEKTGLVSSGIVSVLEDDVT